MKTPVSDWDDIRHDSAALFAKERDIPFVDIMKPDIWEECGFSFDTDFYDGKHLNFNGSLKLTDWLGDYLIGHYNYKDVASSVNPAFSEQDYSHLNQAIEDARLPLCTTLEEYLQKVDNERYTVFVSTQGESSSKLSEEARDTLSRLGLKKLAKLKPNQPYVGIIHAQKCLLDSTSTKKTSVSAKGQFDGHRINVKAAKMQDNAQFDHCLILSSKGEDANAESSIEVDSVERSEKNRGLNFVVYNNESGLLVDTSSFDTHIGSNRTSDLPGD